MEIVAVDLGGTNARFALAEVEGGRVVRLERLQGKWEVVRHADAVAVLALSDAGEMLLVRQPRRAIGGVTLEAPAGSTVVSPLTTLIRSMPRRKAGR